MIVDFVAMAMALGNARSSIDAVRERSGHDVARLCAEAHRPAEIGRDTAPFDRAVMILPFGNERDDRMRRIGIELGAVGVGKACHVARKFDHRELHAETDTEIWNAVLAREANRGDLAL